MRNSIRSVQVFIRHGLDPELVDMLEKIELNGFMEICGSQLIIEETDPEAIPEDIRKITKQVERIQKVYEQVGYPWIAREVLEGKAFLLDGKLIYIKNQKPSFREQIERCVGPVTDEVFKEILEDTTDDIKANNIGFRRNTFLEEVIKIAAQCAQVRQRCGR